MPSYTLRLPDELYELIKQEAARDQRSIHGQIIHLISHGLAITAIRRNQYEPRRCPMCDEPRDATPQPWCIGKDNHDERQP